MKARVILPLALALLAGGPPPAQAGGATDGSGTRRRHDPGLYAGGPGFWVHQHTPVAAPLRVDAVSGASCGYGSHHDDTAVVFNDDRQHGSVTCGPVTIVNEAGGTVDSVTQCFGVQLNSGVHGNNLVDFGCVTQDGNVGALVDTLDYPAAVGDDVYLCTWLSWVSSKGGNTVLYDADDGTPGVQCQLATIVF